MATELFKLKAGIDLFHVPYQGSGPALVDLMAGRIQVMLLQPAVAKPGIDEGKLRALGITMLTRYSQLPDMPTLDEQGVKGFETGSWYGVFAPAGTPPEIVSKLQTVFAQAAKDETSKIEGQGFEVVTNSPDEFRAKLEKEVTDWGEVVKASGVKPEE
jgi:tripartite-type tricarboxylate transporter receptor subunit TctC